MRTIALAVTALLGALLAVGCSDKVQETPTSTSRGPAGSSDTTKADPRAELIKSLEARAAKSEPEAQLALAKMLLDGKEQPPNYSRAAGLLASASTAGLSEATFGLYFLRARKVITDENLPDAKTLKERSMATQDPFVNLFFYLPSAFELNDPPELIVKIAASGNPFALAKLANYYASLAIAEDNCRKMAAAMKTLKIKQSAAEVEKCLRISQVPDKFKRAATYASEIADAKEFEAEKLRYWTQTIRQMNVSKANNSSMSPLMQMQVEHVMTKADPYNSVIADALGQVGRMLKDGNVGANRTADPAQAARFLKRGAELGNAEAQNLMGVLYQTGRGVPKDFEIAARYFAQSAQQGESDGAKNLGKAFARGEGVEKNSIQAYFWLAISSLDIISQTISQGDAGVREQLDDPAAIRDRLARTMSAEDIAAAQRLTREWRPSYQVGPPPAISMSGSGARSVGATAVPSGGVLTKKSTGTVFVVTGKGHAVTNHHVIDGCTELRIEGREGVATRVTEDAVNDLALIQIPGPVPNSAIIAGDSTKLRQGEDIVVFGFPLNAVLSAGGNLTPGVVSALTGLGNNTNQIQITAPIQPGSSGSPVINRKGEVVGVVSAKLSDTKMAKATGSVGQNVNFAVSGRTLKAFLDTQKVDYRSIGLLSFDKSPADLADEARKWTLVLECMK